MYIGLCYYLWRAAAGLKCWVVVHWLLVLQRPFSSLASHTRGIHPLKPIMHIENFQFTCFCLVYAFFSSPSILTMLYTHWTPLSLTTARVWSIGYCVYGVLMVTFRIFLITHWPLVMYIEFFVGLTTDLDKRLLLRFRESWCLLVISVRNKLLSPSHGSCNTLHTLDNQCAYR